MSAGVPKAVWYERGLSSETSKKCCSSDIRLCPVHLFFFFFFLHISDLSFPFYPQCESKR